MLIKMASPSIQNSNKLVNAMKCRSLFLSALWLLGSGASFLGAAAYAAGGPPDSSFQQAESAPPSKRGIFPRYFVSAQLSMNSPATPSMGGWRLVRTPGPEQTGDTVSVMRTAEMLRSDPDFAGLAIRCRPKGGLQIAFVLIAPLPPRSHPKVTVVVNRAAMNFKADVLPPGSMIVLPDEAEVLAKGAWQSAKELEVTIEGEATRVLGIVSLVNLPGAIAQLQASCPTQ